MPKSWPQLVAVSVVSPSYREAEADESLVHVLLTSFVTSRDERVRSEIALRTDWLAVRGARRFSDRGEPFDDLLQVARLGLVKAIDRFDPSREIPFGAYATPTIMGELRRHFRDHTWSLHVPRRAKDVRPLVNAAANELSRLLEKSPTAAQIAERLDISEDAVLEALEANSAYRTASLDTPGTEHADASVDDFAEVLDRDMIVGLLDKLRPRERKILHLRFYEELSQAQIAEQIGTSQVHVGRLISASLRELRSLLDRSPNIL
jgi:RNA polymerase sigma-B factor